MLVASERWHQVNSPAVLLLDLSMPISMPGRIYHPVSDLQSQDLIPGVPALTSIFHIMAETCSQYLAKGSRVYFEGRLQTRSWEGQDGQKRYATEIVATDMIMLDSRQAADVASGRGGEDELEDVAMDGGGVPF